MVYGRAEVDGIDKPSVLLACPGVEQGGCEMYAAMLVDDLATAAFLTVVTPLRDEERRELGLFAGSPHIVEWPACNTPDRCRGHGLEWKALFTSTRPDQFVLVANSPTSVDDSCRHSLQVAMAAAGVGVPTTVIFQFVPDPCPISLPRGALARAAEMQTWVCVSRHSRYLLSEATGAALDCIQVVPNGVTDTDDSPNRPEARKRLLSELGLSDDVAMLATVARLVPSKRHEDALRAAAELRDDGRNVHLVWAGTGPARGDLAALATRAKMADRVHFLGHRSDVPDLLAAADVVVAPTVAEGLSFALLEAMATGRPIVAADATSNPELIVDRHTGLLATPADPSSYATAIGSLLDNPELARRLGNAAQIRQRALFTRTGMISGARKAIFGS